MVDYRKLIEETRAELGADVEGNTAFRVGQAVGGAAHTIDPNVLEAERRKQATVKAPTARASLQHSVRGSQTEFRKLRRAAGVAASAIRQAKDLDPSYKEEALADVAKTQTQLNAKPDEGVVQNLIKYGGKTISGTLGLIDAVDRQTRHLTTPGRERDVTSLLGNKPTDVTTEQWNEAIRSRMGKFERPGDLASNFAGRVGQLVGEGVGTFLSPVPVALGIAADLAEGKVPSYENIEKTRAATTQDVGDFARSAIFSPLNVIGGFKSGGLKVAEQIVKLGKETGLADDALRAIAKTYLAEYAASAGPRESLEAGIRAAEKALGAEGARKAFGQNFEFLGKEGLKIGVGKLSAEVPVQKITKSLATKAGVPGAADLFDPGKEIARVTAKRSKVFRASAEQKNLADWTPVAKLASEQGVSPARLGALLKKGKEAGTIVFGTPASEAERKVVAAAHDVLARQRLKLKTAGIDAPIPARTGPEAVEIAHKGGFEIALSQNAKEQARMLAQKNLEREIANQFGGQVPEFAKSILNSTHDDAFATASRFIHKYLNAPNVARGVAWWERQANAMKRGVLMKRPGYHALNVWNDSLQMVGAGMNNPVKWLGRADDLVKAARNGDARAGRILAEAQKEGIAVNELARADYEGDVVRGAKELRRVAQGKQGKSALQQVDEVGDRFSERWENTSKLAMYLWSRDRGMPSWASARVAFDNLIDYADRGKALQVMRWFTPFITWAAKMPKLAATQIVQRPARIANIVRAVNQVSGNEYNEPRSYIKDRETLKALPSPLRRLYSAGRQAFGGSPVAEGEAINFAPSLPYEEGFQLPRAVGGALGAIPQAFAGQDEQVRESLRPLLGQFGPGVRALTEMFTGKDIQTGQPVDLKLTGMLPAQVAPPWVPEGLVTTGEEEQGLIPKHFVNYLPGVRNVGPGAVLAANYAIARSGKPGGLQPPMSYYGFNRPFTYGADRDDLSWNQLLNFATGAGFFSTLPEGATWSAAHAPSVQEAISKARFGKKLRKEGPAK